MRDRRRKIHVAYAPDILIQTVYKKGTKSRVMFTQKKANFLWQSLTLTSKDKTPAGEDSRIEAVAVRIRSFMLVFFWGKLGILCV